MANSIVWPRSTNAIGNTIAPPPLFVTEMPCWRAWLSTIALTTMSSRARRGTIPGTSSPKRVPIGPKMTAPAANRVQASMPAMFSTKVADELGVSPETVRR